MEIFSDSQEKEPMFETKAEESIETKSNGKPGLSNAEFRAKFFS